MTGNDKLSIDESDSSVPSLPDTDSEPELPEDDEPTQSHSSSHNKVVQEFQNNISLHYKLPC